MKYGYVILEMFWIVSGSQKGTRKAIYKSVYKNYMIIWFNFLRIKQSFLKIIANIDLEDNYDKANWHIWWQTNSYTGLYAKEKGDVIQIIIY